MKDDEQTPDGLPLRFAAQFGFGLLVYLLIGMLLFIATAVRYSGKEQAAIFVPPGAGLAVSMGFAVFARAMWGWKGFLWGAILGSVLIVGLAVAFFVFVTVASFDLQG